MVVAPTKKTHRGGPRGGAGLVRGALWLDAAGVPSVPILKSMSYVAVPTVNRSDLKSDPHTCNPHLMSSTLLRTRLRATGGENRTRAGAGRGDSAAETGPPGAERRF